jgi:hypothetical protein
MPEPAPQVTSTETVDTADTTPKDMTGEEAVAFVRAQKEGAPSKVQPKDAVTSNTVKDAVAEAIKKYKVKVDGEELEVDEKELLRGYSHQRAANKIFQEGKAARTQAEQFVSMMKDKAQLFDVIKKLGHDPRSLAEEYLASQLEEEMLEPREKELRDAKRKLQAWEDMDKKKQQEVEKQRHEELKAKYAKDFNTQFVEALQQTGLPPTKPMVAEMAKYISRSAKIGFEMSPKEAAQLVLEDLQTAHRKLAGDSDAETLLKLIGDDAANKIRKWDVSRLKDPNHNLKTPTEPSASKEPRSKRTKRMTPKEWRDFNRAR